MSLKQNLERFLAKAGLRLPTALHRTLAGEPSAVNYGMPLAPELQFMLNIRSTIEASGFKGVDILSARKRFDSGATLLGPSPAPLAEVRDICVQGAMGPLFARVYRPFGLPFHKPCLVFFHGGGFVLGSLDSHDLTCRKIAAETPCIVISTDYRLAPEHPYPAAAQDAIAVFRYLAERANQLGLNPDRIAVGGDSTGGNLAAVVAQKTLRDDVRPCFQLLLYPALDLTMSSRAVGAFKDLWLDKGDMAWFYDQYMPSWIQRNASLASPLLGSVEGLPPACIVTGGFDPLAGEGRLYAQRLSAAGVPVEELRYAGLTHGFLHFCGDVREAKSAVDEVIRSTRKWLAHGLHPIDQYLMCPH